jgi:lysophospholipase L1-like esterase
LDEKYVDHPEIGVERKIRATSGLVRYDAKNEALDWPQAAKEELSHEKPNVIVVMLGLNDRVPLRENVPAQPKPKGEPAQEANQSADQTLQEKAAAPADAEARSQTAGQIKSQQPVPGGSYDFHTDQWAALYAKRIDAMIAAVKSKGVPVIWVGLPAIRGAKATSDMSYLDELYRERAERAGLIYVDIWDGFVDEDGDYAMQGPDFEGQIRRLRTADGVHFTKAGAVKIASYVDRELQRVMPSPVAPVALPAPETTPKSGSASARPDVGPVLPLNSSTSDHDSELLGGKDHTTQTTSIAAKVLSRGETLAAPAGRADDFSWPRKDVIARPKGSPEPVAAAPSTAENQGPATKGDGKNQADAKKDAKDKSKISSHVSAREPVAAAPSTPENQGPATKGDDKNQADAKKDAKEKSKIGPHVSARVSHPYYNYYSGRQYGSYRGNFSSGRDELTSGAR